MGDGPGPVLEVLCEIYVNGSWHYRKDLPKKSITSFAALQRSFQRPKRKI